MMRNAAMTRRRVLRGAAGGMAVSVGVPFLDAVLNENGTALAAGAPLPVRYGTWFWGCGLTPGRWTPQQEGAGYAMPVELEVLEPFRDQLSIFSGFGAILDGRPAVPHWTGQMSILTGAAPARDGQIEAPTMDTVIADAIGAKTRFRSLEVAASGNPEHSYSRRSTSVINPAEISPVELYKRVFGPDFKDPNAANFTPDPRVMLHNSVLSVVTEERNDFMRHLGHSDRIRMDQYFTSVRQFQQLAMQLEKPAPLEACAIPKPPPETPIGSDVDWVIANHKLMAELIAFALACGQTNVFNVVFIHGQSTLRTAGDSVGHHQLTHEEPIDPSLGYQPKATWYAARCIDGFAAFLGALEAIKEGDGTLLDHSLVFACTDSGYAKIHSLNSIPMFIAGKAGGRIRSGVHVAGQGDPVTRVGLTAQQAVGLSVGSWGAGSMQTSKTLSQILV
jgi:hypothetical protein